MHSTTKSQSNVIRAISVALTIWGVFIAVGVFRFSQQRGHAWTTSFLMSSIVALVVAGFFVLWSLTRLTQRTTDGTSADTDNANSHKRQLSSNWSCVIALIMALISSPISLSVRFDELESVGFLGRLLFWLSSAGIGTALLLGIVGLSNPRQKNAKWTGLAALAVIAVTVICWLFGGVRLPQPDSTLGRARVEFPYGHELTNYLARRPPFV